MMLRYGSIDRFGNVSQGHGLDTQGQGLDKLSKRDQQLWTRTTCAKQLWMSVIDKMCQLVTDEKRSNDSGD